MAVSRPSGNLVEIIERHGRDIGRLKSRLTGLDLTADHGGLTGLSDDDHTQYLNASRHDSHDHSAALGSALIEDLAQVTADPKSTNDVIQWGGSNWRFRSLSEAGISATGHTHDGRYYTESESDGRFVNEGGDTMAGVLRMGGHTFDTQGGKIDMGGGEIHYSGTAQPYLNFTSSYIGILNGNWALLGYNGRTEVRQNLDATAFRFYGDTNTSITRPATNHMDLNAGGALKLRIGTGSPTVHIKAPYSSGQSILHLDIERRWDFLQRGTGSGTDLELRSETNKAFWIGDSSNGAIAEFQYGNVHIHGRSTTTNSGLAAWRNDGFPGTELLALTSSIRNKNNVRNLDYAGLAQKFFNIRLVDWNSVLEKDNPARRYAGWIAEEVAPVLPDYAGKPDEDGFVGAIGSLEVPMAAALHYHEDRISELEAKVAELEAAS